MLKNFQRLIGKNLKRIIIRKGSGLLSSIELKAPLSNIPVLGHICFKRYKMNAVNRFLEAGVRFKAEMNLRQPRFAYSVSISFKEYKTEEE